MKRIICLLIVTILVIAGSVSYAADIITDSEADVSTKVENNAEIDEKIEPSPSPIPTAVLTDEESVNGTGVPQSSSSMENDTQNKDEMETTSTSPQLQETDKTDKIDNNDVSYNDNVSDLIFDINRQSYSLLAAKI